MTFESIQSQRMSMAGKVGGAVWMESIDRRFAASGHSTPPMPLTSRSGGEYHYNHSTHQVGDPGT